MAASVPESVSSRPQSGVVSPVRQVRSRTQSISSDRPSTIGPGLTSPPLSISPEAAFVASSAASQIVTNDHDSHADAWYDQHGIEPAGETALVSPSALTLVNSFLDQLLFNFLQVSRATTLAALRPAVSEVLKPKLAKDAINNADEELREYLGGADEDDYVQPQGGDPSRDWDLELVWKRTRLRCMVYSSLGDMEEEDEDLYMEQENLEIGADEQISDVISPAVAIFLTSVLEYMGELTLTVAGQAAYHRMRARFEKDLRDGVRTHSDIADRIVVEELDMERVALDRTLGRLWRGWKKRIRTPTVDSLARQLSLRSHNTHSRVDSLGQLADTGTPRTMSALDSSGELRKSQDHKGDVIVEDVLPMDIPLPLRDTDIEEIEVPGLVAYSDDEEEGDDEEDTNPKRPWSLFMPPVLGESMLELFAGEATSPQRKRRTGSLPSSTFKEFLTRVEKERRDSQQTEAHAAVGDSVAVEEHEDQQPKTKTRAARASEADSIGVAMTSDDPVTVEGVASPGDFESADEDVMYEKAEIVTSAKVSVTGSSSPTNSSSDKLDRAPSARSARIVEVAAPPPRTSSRPSSLEAAREAARPSSQPDSEGVSPLTPDEMVQPMDSQPQPVIHPVVAPVPRTSIERRPVPQNAATISEVEEPEANYVAQARTSPPTAQSRHAHVGYAPSGRHASSSRHELSNSANTKVTILGSGNGSGTFEAIPEIPPKAPGHSARQRVEPSFDRTRTRESEETTAFSPQTNGNVPRPTHTSQSSVSSNTGRLKAVRTSEEAHSNRAEAMARNFEELIHSNQTITYTLTPEHMRDPNVPDSPSMPRFSSPANEAKASSPQFRAAPVSSQSGLEGSPRTSPRIGGGQARDARIPAESTADFADFIKSTGPPGDNRPVPFKNSNGPVAPAKSSSESYRVASSSNRSRYQPRDAAVSEKGDNSDLIDFIRQGPPSSGGNNPRIPRHVAPFRNTMDSDQMAMGHNGRPLDGGIPEVRNSQASTNMTENSMPSMQSSMQSSVNSSSALLKKSQPNKLNKSPPSRSPPIDNSPHVRPGNMFDEDDMMPKRKQTRVRDPYAIDFSDEDDDEELFATVTPKPPVKQEESLAEFLRNYQPPTGPPSPPPTVQKQPKKKMSAPGLMARFRNTYSRGSDARSHSPVSTPTREPDSASLNGVSGSKGHIPIQVTVPAGYDRYGPVESPRGRPRMGSTQSGSGKIPMKKFEPRDAVSDSTGTDDLAAFLRDSEPPPGNAGPRAYSPIPEESNGISKMFKGRKKLGLA